MKNMELRRKWAELRAANQAVLDKAKSENRAELNGEELEQFEKRQGDIDRVAKQIELTERHAEQEAMRDKPAAGEADNGGFRNLGEFIYTARFNPGKLAERAMSMGTGSEGGFNLPEQFRSELLMVRPEASIVRPRAQVIPAGEPPDAKITMPALDQGAHGAMAGVTVTWISEGGAKAETSTAFKEVSLEPSEVAGYITVTDKLLRNWQASSAFIANILREAIAGAEDYKFLRGNGVGCPVGVIDAANTAKISVARNAASDVKFVDVATMLGKMQPDSLSRAVWVASITTLPKIVNIQDDLKASIFIRGDVTRAIPDTLFGRPIIWTGKVPVLGTEGDLGLYDFSYYLIKDGSGPFVAASEHVNFTTNKTVVKAFWNVDAKPWPVEALLLEDAATTVSPFVTLQ